MILLLAAFPGVGGSGYGIGKPNHRYVYLLTDYACITSRLVH